VAEVVHLLPRWTQQDWMVDARCKGRTETFFPPFGEQPDARRLREAAARSICRCCPVLTVCREYARRHREQGFWGGENDEERARAGRHSRARPPSRPRPAVGG
jgi:hypothetical protein